MSSFYLLKDCKMVDMDSDYTVVEGKKDALDKFLADMKTPRCQSTDKNGNQCGFEKGHELKPEHPDNYNHPRHGWAGKPPMIPSWD